MTTLSLDPTTPKNPSKPELSRMGSGMGVGRPGKSSDPLAVVLTIPIFYRMESGMGEGRPGISSQLLAVVLTLLPNQLPLFPSPHPFYSALAAATIMVPPPRSLLWLPLIVPALLSSATATWKKTSAELEFPMNLRPANEGVSHDGSFWYYSNQHVLYKATKYPISVVQSRLSIPSELHDLSYDHIGDIDVDPVGGVLYAGLESSDSTQVGILAVYNTSDLSLLRYARTSQRGLPWVAADYDSRVLYSNDWGDVAHLQTYDMDSFEFKGTLDCTLPPEVQGAAFFKGDLYLSSNVDVSVWRVDVGIASPVAEMVVSEPQRKVLEMEGLTFWEDDELKANGLGEMFFYGNFMTTKALHSYTLVEDEN